MTRLAGYQPQYFPRLHYFARILNADIFKISDTLQYVRRHAYPPENGKKINGPSYQAHTPIKTSKGLYLLDIPVRHEGKKEERMLNAVPLDYQTKWNEKHLRTIEISYAKAPEFKRLFPSLISLLTNKYPNLAACTIATTVWGLGVLFEMPGLAFEAYSISEIAPLLSQFPFKLKKIVTMSELEMAPAHKTEGESVNDWIISSCKALDADEYYMGGTAAAAYIDRNKIESAGITLVKQEWQGGPYAQQFPAIPFLPNLSVIDLLMNTLPEEARRILSTRNQP